MQRERRPPSAIVRGLVYCGPLVLRVSYLVWTALVCHVCRAEPVSGRSEICCACDAAEMGRRRAGILPGETELFPRVGECMPGHA
jgi:hypothetical protein